MSSRDFLAKLRKLFLDNRLKRRQIFDSFSYLAKELFSFFVGRKVVEDPDGIVERIRRSLANEDAEAQDAVGRKP